MEKKEDRTAEGEREIKNVAVQLLVPRLSGRWHLSRGGRSKRVSAMTHKVISPSFVIPTALAIVLGIVLAVGGVYLGHYLGPVDQAEANQSVAGSRGSTELPPDGRLSRIHLLLSNMK